MSRVQFHPTGVPRLRADVADAFYHFIRAGGICIATCAEARESHLSNRCGRESDDEHCSKFRSSAALNGTSCAGEQMGGTARMIHGSSLRNRAVAKRDRRAEPRGREACLKQYVDRPSGEPTCLDAVPTVSRLVTAANPRLEQKCS